MCEGGKGHCGIKQSDCPANTLPIAVIDPRKLGDVEGNEQWSLLRREEEVELLIPQLLFLSDPNPSTGEPRRNTEKERFGVGVSNGRIKSDGQLMTTAVERMRGVAKREWGAIEWKGSERELL